MLLLFPNRHEWCWHNWLGLDRNHWKEKLVSVLTAVWVGILICSLIMETQFESRGDRWVLLSHEYGLIWILSRHSLTAWNQLYSELTDGNRMRRRKTSLCSLCHDCSLCSHTQTMKDDLMIEYKENSNVLISVCSWHSLSTEISCGNNYCHRWMRLKWIVRETTVDISVQWKDECGFQKEQLSVSF